MSNIFIGWSGNKDLADEVAFRLNRKKDIVAVVGGGHPKDMFIGAQVIDQINRCDSAILLVEDKNGFISPNLMFEWGYIVAKFPVENVYAYLINKSYKDLPSDLLGSWVNEIMYERDNSDVEETAEKIVKLFDEHRLNASVRNYFDLISGWKQVYTYMTDNIPDSDRAICEYILSGCLAAYYYQDNKLLRQTLNGLKVSDTVNIVVMFAKAYIDVFLRSANMTKPLSEQDLFNCMQTMDMVIERNKTLPEDIELLLDILAYDVYGLACVLFLRNEGLDDETKNFCAEKARSNLEKGIELTEEFGEKYKNNKCLVQLLKSYLHNDLGHLYKDAYNDMEAFIRNLKISVEQRKSLFQSFVNYYPANTFLATKLEQEYIIALSEQCNYMEDSILKTMYKKSVISKFEEWQRELVYTSSLTDRIKKNISMFK